MSTFLVQIKKIDELKNHENADSLELAKVNDLDYQFVVRKGEYSIGDIVVYFPIDSLLPDNIISILGLTGRLSGKNANRVKTIKLRGEISQGIVCKPTDLDVLGDKEYSIDEDVTAILNVEKYEPPMATNIFKDGRVKVKVRTLPSTVPHYDIESVERFKYIVDLLMEHPVYITEKLEGSNFCCGIDTRLDPNIFADNFFVASRNQVIIPDPESLEPHAFWKCVEKQNFLELCKTLFKNEAEHQLVIRGEIIGPGVQGNIYKLSDYTVKIFDILIDDKYASAQVFARLYEEHEFDIVPVLVSNMTLRDWLGGKTVKEASHGNSILNANTLREGIVIKPYNDISDDSEIGRIILKQRDPIYLCKHDS